MPEGKQRGEDFPVTFDDVLLEERAEFGRKLIRSNENVDPYEVLAAVVWPTPYAVEQQIESRRERGLSVC